MMIGVYKILVPANAPMILFHSVEFILAIAATNIRPMMFMA